MWKYWKYFPYLIVPDVEALAHDVEALLDGKLNVRAHARQRLHDREITLVDLQLDLLHDAEVAGLTVDAVSFEILWPRLNDGDTLPDEQRHVALVHPGEQLQRGTKHGLFLDDASLHQLLHVGPPHEEPP